MNPAFAPSPWPASSGQIGAAAWRFAHQVLVPGRDGPRQALQWVLKRNCSITPRQMLGVYLSLCTISLAVAMGFWFHGAPYVLGFAGAELLLVGLALLVYARHAGDHETVTLADREVNVEQWYGGQVERAAFRAEWVCVEPAQAQGSLVELAGQGRRVHVGRFVRPELRSELAQELRRAVRSAQAGLPAQDTEWEVQR